MAFAMEFHPRSLSLQLLLLACLSFFHSVVSDDGATLLEIKKSFRDVENVLYDWTDSPSSDYCVWRGVNCDNVTFYVNALNLSGLNLDGEISPAIGDLKGLLSIDLRGNRLSGQIPDEIGDCSSLKSLDLSFNLLYGDIPFSVSKLKRLECLGLRGNNLVGTLSPDMCQLTGLWYFDVRNNSLTGAIPQDIGNCTAFQGLVLQPADWGDSIQYWIPASSYIIFARIQGDETGSKHCTGQYFDYWSCVDKNDSFERAKKWVQELQKQGNPNMVMALAGNKADLEDKRKVTAEEARVYAEENGLFFMETSAKATVNVNDMFYEIAKRLPRAQPAQNPAGMVLVDRPSEGSRAASCCS